MNNRIQHVEELAREAIPIIFRELLSMEIQVEEPIPLPDDPGGQIIGSVGFTGDATGMIYLYASMTFARQITSVMLGIATEEVDSDEMVADAIGELSNMVVGRVKSRLCDSGHPCTLTIPSVVRGRQMSVEAPSGVRRRVIGFHQGQHRLLAEMLVKD